MLRFAARKCAHWRPKRHPHPNKRVRIGYARHTKQLSFRLVTTNRPGRQHTTRLVQLSESNNYNDIRKKYDKTQHANGAKTIWTLARKSVCRYRNKQLLVTVLKIFMEASTPLSEKLLQAMVEGNSTFNPAHEFQRTTSEDKADVTPNTATAYRSKWIANSREVGRNHNVRAWVDRRFQSPPDEAVLQTYSQALLKRKL